MTSLDGWVLPESSPTPERTGEIEVPGGGARVRYPVRDPEETRSLCATLRAEGKRVFTGLPAREIPELLGAVGARFLAPGDELRATALELLPTYSGLSPEMARWVLDRMARDWTAPRLSALLEAELGDPSLLDRFGPDPRGVGARTRAVGPGLTLHVCASTAPGVSVTSLLRSLLVKSAAFLKPGRSDVVLPVLFARGLGEEAPELARCVAVAYWPGAEDGEESSLSPASRAAVEEADAVVVYGSDAVVRTYRDATPVTRIFQPYRHRVGVALVGREGLGRESAARTAEAVARAVAAYEQRGCVSPHTIYVERGGGVTPREWTDLLGDAFRELEESLPSAPLTTAEASEIHQIRGTAEMRSEAGEAVRVRHGGPDPWTVILDEDPGFRPSCTGRVVHLRPVEELAEAYPELARVGPHLQTACLAGVGERREQVAEALVRLGVLRVTSPERAPWPPSWWHHDGRGPLEALLRWVDLEEGSLPIPGSDDGGAREGHSSG